jgi:hypothetical protein
MGALPHELHTVFFLSPKFRPSPLHQAFPLSRLSAFLLTISRRFYRDLRSFHRAAVILTLSFHGCANMIPHRPPPRDFVG